MARGVNKVILLGNLGSDPEVRYMPNGNAVVSFSVATSDSWKDRDTGQQQERTEWHRVVIFGKLAEIAGEYLRKGSKVYLEGANRTRKWTDQNKVDRYTTEVVLSMGGQMQMLDSPRASENGNQGNWSPPPPADQQAAPQPSQTQQQPAPGFDDFDDDIPF